MLVACDIGDRGQQKVAFGSIWISHTDGHLDEFNKAITHLRIVSKCWGSFQWKKTKNEHYLEIYKQLIDIFFGTGVNYSCLVVDKDVFRTHGAHIATGFNDAVPEFSIMHLTRRVGRYCNAVSKVTVLIDQGEHKDQILKIKTQMAVYSAINLPETSIKIDHVQEVNSRSNTAVQLCDILTGAVSKGFNGTRTSAENKAIYDYIESKLGRSIAAPTWPSETKFNIWYWQPRNIT